MQRIDRLITPPGWIAGAQMYTLVFNNGTLYLIHTGKAVNPTNLYHPMEKYRYLAERMQAVADVKIKEKQALIDTAGPDSAMDSKKSAKFSRSEIEEMVVTDSAFKGEFILLKAGGKKFILVFEKSRKEEANAFVKAVMG